MGAENAVSLDLKGLKCPLPVLRTRKALKGLKSGDHLKIETTDPLAVLDIPHMCHEDGHELVSQQATQTGHEFLIAKA